MPPRLRKFALENIEKVILGEFKKGVEAEDKLLFCNDREDIPYQWGIILGGRSGQATNFHEIRIVESAIVPKGELWLMPKRLFTSLGDLWKFRGS